MLLYTLGGLHTDGELVWPSRQVPCTTWGLIGLALYKCLSFIAGGHIGQEWQLY